MEKTVTITAVGDICLADHILCSGFGVKSMIEKYGSKFIFRNVESLFEDTDINFGNLECILSDKGFVNNDISSTLFRGNPEYISILRDAGFNVLNIANNHTMHHGINAFQDMKNLLGDSSIKPLGVKGSNGFISNPVIFEKNNKKIALLGYSFEKDRYPDNELLYARGDYDGIKSDIAKLKEQTDFIIISCHWGLELMNSPSNNTIKMARQLVDMGADIILGHHSHTLQGVEKYRDKLIIYSLGNFVFDLQWDINTRKTGIFKIFIDGMNSISYKFIPVFINDQCQPTLIDDKSEKFFISDNITQFPDENIEYENLYYYTEYNRREKKLYYKKILFLCKNIWRMKIKVLFYFVGKKLMQKFWKCNKLKFYT